MRSQAHRDKATPPPGLGLNQSVSLTLPSEVKPGTCSRAGLPCWDSQSHQGPKDWLCGKGATQANLSISESLAVALCAQYLHVFLNEVTTLVPVLNEDKHSFALYTPERTRQRWPVRLATATEQDMNDWVSGQWPYRPGIKGRQTQGSPALARCPSPSQW